MNAPRANREQEVRATTERAAPTRDVALAPDFEDRGVFYIDPSIVPQGMRYEWKVEYVLGEYQRESLQANMRRGWRPVPASRHPEIVPPVLPGQEADTVVRAGNCLLMERSEDLTRQYEDHIRRETDERTRAKQIEMGQSPHPETMPRMKPELTTEVLPA